MNKITSKGFTIIELLVVVAIIAVLAAIVLVNVTGYINQGKNAAIKGNLATVLTNAAVYYDAHGTYNDGANLNFCADAGMTAPEAAITAAYGSAATTHVCTAITWCDCSLMKTTNAEPVGSTFCVDSSGYKKVTGTACATRCPNTGVCVDS